jgi:hypothetical protein
MLDALAILSTCALLLLVALRAMRMDRAEPWFPPVDPAATPEAGPEPRGRGRRASARSGRR